MTARVWTPTLVDRNPKLMSPKRRILSARLCGSSTIHTDVQCASLQPLTMLVCMVDERETGSIPQKQTRGFLENGYYLMSVSLQFGKGLWNIPFGSFKLPTSELKNTKIKYAATLKHSWHSHKHTPQKHTIAQGNNRGCVSAWPSIITVSWRLLAAGVSATTQQIQYFMARHQYLFKVLLSHIEPDAWPPLWELLYSTKLWATNISNRMSASLASNLPKQTITSTPYLPRKGEGKEHTARICPFLSEDKHKAETILECFSLSK